MSIDVIDDYWTQCSSTAETSSKPIIDIINIDGVVPLDKQFGVAKALTVPEALYDALFSPVEQTNADDVAPHYTYAVLDAAKIPNLPELLDASGLKHRCLFKGEAYDTSKEAAPWVVQLEDGNSFLLSLFTQSEAPWHHWEAAPGIYLRSNAPLDDIWNHFRHFVKLQKTDGSWLYFRFWDPCILLKIMTSATPSFPDPALLFGAPVASFVMLDPSTEKYRVAMRPAEIPKGRLVCSERMISVLQDFAREQFAQTLIAHCTPRFPGTFARMTPDDASAMMLATITAAERLNLNTRGPVTSFAEMRIVLGFGVHSDPMYPWVADGLRQATHQSQMAIMEALVATFSQYNEAVNGPGNRAFFEALARARAALDSPPEPSYLHMLARVFPEKFNWIGSDAAQAFLMAMSQQLSAYRDLDTDTVRAYILLCYFMGYRCVDDPQYTWIGPTLQRSATPDAMGSPLVRKCHTWLDAVLDREIA